jgi:hypothetical protein
MLIIPRWIRTLPYDNPLPRKALERVHRPGRDVYLLPRDRDPRGAVEGDLQAALAHMHDLGVVPVPVGRHLEEVVAGSALGGAL